MRTRYAAIFVASILAGCSNNLNTSCDWPDESPAPLDVQNRSDSQHLLRDVERAEELSIRFGDERWSPGPARARGRHEQCLAPLLQHIAGLHGVPLEDVLAARERISERGLNLRVNGPVAIVIVALAAVVLVRIRRRFSVSEEPLAVAGATALCSVLVGGVTVAAGRLWEAVVEIIRLGNGHLTYRGLRLPWTQHSLEYASVATAIFAFVSILFFLHIRRSTSTSHPV